MNAKMALCMPTPYTDQFFDRNICGYCRQYGSTIAMNNTICKEKCVLYSKRACANNGAEKDGENKLYWKWHRANHDNNYKDELKYAQAILQVILKDFPGK